MELMDLKLRGKKTRRTMTTFRVLVFGVFFKKNAFSVNAESGNRGHLLLDFFLNVSKASKKLEKLLLCGIHTVFQGCADG